MTGSVHASAVAFAGRGMLILGPSGSGKSALALQLLALGAGLIADDRVLLSRRGGALVAGCPPPLRGLIEARGVGILAAAPALPAAVVLAVDLGRAEPARLPLRRTIALMDVTLPLVLGPLHPHLAAALRQMMLSGRAF